MGYREMKKIHFTWDDAIVECQLLKKQGYSCLMVADGFVLINDDLQQMVVLQIRTPNKKGKAGK